MVVEDKEVAIPDEELTPKDDGSQGGKEEVKEEGGKKEPAPEDHPSKLGRKVARMGEQFDSLTSKLDTLLARMEEQATRPSPSHTANQDDEVPDHIREAADYTERRLTEKQRKAQEEQDRYTRGYVETIRKGLKEEEEIDEEFHGQIVKDVLETGVQSYLRYTGNPKTDAEINYRLSMAKLLKGQTKERKAAPNVKGDKRTAATDVGSTSSDKGTPRKRTELDSYAKKFIAAIGAKEDDEWVQESLNRE